MKRGPFFVTDRDVPPVNRESADTSRHTKCGWCTAHVGDEHDRECVIRKRSVVLSLSSVGEFVSTIPESWDAETLEFVHNGNLFCASNYLDQLYGEDYERECVCGDLEYVREADEEDEGSLPWAYSWSHDA